MKPFAKCCKKQSWECGRINGWCMQTKHFKGWCDFEDSNLCSEKICTCCRSKYKWKNVYNLLLYKRIKG